MGYLFFLGSFFILCLLLFLWFAQRLAIKRRLARRLAVFGAVEEEEAPVEFPWREWLAGVAASFGKYAPQRQLEASGLRLVMAGFPSWLKPEIWLLFQLVLAFVLAVGFFTIGVILKLEPGKLIVLCLLGVVGGFLFPELLLLSRKEKRQLAIARSLPDVLDILTISVEAGLGFDAALGKVAERMEGPLADELRFVLHELWLGKSRRESLRNLGDRTGVEDLRLVTAAIIQADQLGSSIGAVLRIQSDQMRVKRRQRAEEAAMKAPIKMLIPMVLFIFPTIFIILLGPALIQILMTFDGM